MPDYFIGIDGGGTSCRAAVADASGQILGRARGGAANILTNLEGALGNIVSTAERPFARRVSISHWVRFRPFWDLQAPMLQSRSMNLRYGYLSSRRGSTRTD